MAGSGTMLPLNERMVLCMLGAKVQQTVGQWNNQADGVCAVHTGNYSGLYETGLGGRHISQARTNGNEWMMMCMQGCQQHDQEQKALLSLLK